MNAMDRVDKYYVRKNPVLKNFIAESKLNDGETKTLEIRNIIKQSDSLISLIEVSKNEINSISEIQGTHIKNSTIELLEHLKKFELQTQEILKQQNDNDSTNDKQNVQAYSETIKISSTKHSKYQNALSEYFRKNGIDQKQVDSIVSTIKNN